MKAALPLHLIKGNTGQISHIAVGCKINNRDAMLIIDSGASNCVLDMARSGNFNLVADRSFGSEMAVGLGSNQIKSSLSRADVFLLGEIEIKQFPFVMLDLQIINDTFLEYGSVEIDGIIGTDLLLACDAKIDYKQKLLFLKGNKRRLQKVFKHPFQFH
jgi:hypothetical protein